MDLSHLLEPIAEDKPCGDEGSLFLLEDMIREQGAGIVAGAERESREPNWAEFLDKAIESFEQFKHVQTAVFISLGLLQRDGLTGFRDGAIFLKDVLLRYWQDIYPKLDPDDSMGDPDGWMERENTFNDMDAAVGASGSTLHIVRRLRMAPLCNSRQIGRFSLRDIDLAENPPDQVEDGKEIPGMSLIRGAFEDTSTDDMQAAHDAIVESMAALSELSDGLKEHLQRSSPPAFSNISATLTAMLRPVKEDLLRRGIGAEEEEEAGEEAGEEGEAARGPARPAGINSRQDVLKAFGAIYKYYTKMEPTSPVPLIIKRAERMVNMNFFEIINDIAPGALADVERISGMTIHDPIEAPNTED